jgi:DNA-binding NtrC family response regulator
MQNQATGNASAGNGRGYATHSNEEQAEARTQPIEVLHVPVGTNLADVERWMIFATLRKCGGNKTRAAALLGVSLKTLYNRLNAYRAQGLLMDYPGAPESEVEITRLHGELTEVPL